MSIFINKETRIVVQGVTGQEGSFWTKHMLDMGATVVAGVTPGKEGQDVHRVWHGLGHHSQNRLNPREHPQGTEHTKHTQSTQG